MRDRRHHEYVRSSKIRYSRSHSRSHSNSPHTQRHDHLYNSPKRGQKSPQRITSKSSKHTSRDIPILPSHHNSRSSRKSSHSRPKYSRSPSKNVHTHSKSPSPAKDTRISKKHSDCDSPEGHISVSKKKRPTKSPAKQYNSKVKLSETSLFAELVRDRQMRELAMKCLTQINTKTVDENEVVEIHDDSDNEQNNTKIDDSNTNSVIDDVDSCIIVDITENISKPEVEISNMKSVTSSMPDMTSKHSEEYPVISIPEVEIIENGIEHSLEPISTLSPSDNTVPEIIENKDLTKMALPLPPEYPEHNELSPDSEIKCSKKSIKDLPLPPGKIFNLFARTL